MTRKRIMRISLLTLIFSIMAITNAFASGGTYWSDGGDLSAYGDEIQKIYDTVTSIALPLGAISLVFAAFKMFGDEKSIATAKKQILYTILALIAILILPAVIKLGVDLGIARGWDPSVGMG